MPDGELSSFSLFLKADIWELSREVRCTLYDSVASRLRNKCWLNCYFDIETKKRKKEKKKILLGTHNESFVIHFVPQVLRDNTVKREELKARALALKILGNIFQVLYEIEILHHVHLYCSLIARGQEPLFPLLKCFLVFLKIHRCPTSSGHFFI